MSDIEAAPEATVGRPGSRLDRVLNTAIVVLLVGVLGLAGWFGYSVWSFRQEEQMATPALRSIQDLENRVQTTPNDVSLRVRLGESLAAAGLTDQAVQQLTAALKLDAKHTGAYLDLGLIALGQGDRTNAKQYFQKVVDLTTGSDMQNVNDRREIAFFDLGVIANQEKRYEDAVGFFKEALRIRRDASDSYYNLARSYEGLGDNNAALKQLEIALAFDPNYAQAHYEMGKIYASEGDTINAAVHLATAGRLAPSVDVVQEALAALGTEGSWIAKARQVYASGDLKTAVNAALVARALAPDDVAAVKLHAQILEKKGNRAGALKVYKEAAKLAPQDAEVTAAISRLSGK
jgi:tetratricopeptide (TPR) repeat protein